MEHVLGAAARYSGGCALSARPERPRRPAQLDTPAESLAVTSVARLIAATAQVSVTHDPANLYSAIDGNRSSTFTSRSDDDPSRMMKRRFRSDSTRLARSFAYKLVSDVYVLSYSALDY
ncbi:unnamed protein product, partial [Iphiclides podalirius]